MPTHAEKRKLPYSPEQMFDLVADVEKYPEFLPWCVATRIQSRQGDTIAADMAVGYKMFREKFTSIARLDRAGMRIDIEYREGPFRYLNNHWVFERDSKGCAIDFYIDFEFRSQLLEKAITAVFNRAVTLMVVAFEKRARAIYGPRAK
jgi:coenzyme Q-binding protein COQ10